LNTANSQPTKISSSQKPIIILSVLLLIQIAFSLALKIEETNTQQKQSIDEKLIKIDYGKLEKIVINERENDAAKTVSISMQKKTGRWYLPSDVGADADKIIEFVKDLQNLKKGIPITNSKDAPERFHVDDNNYLRQIVLESKGVPATVINVGAASTADELFVKIPGAKDQNIYSVELPKDKLSAEIRSWIDNKFVKIERSKIKELVMNDFILKVNPPSSWTLNTQGKDFTVCPENALSHLDRLAQLEIRSVSNTKPLGDPDISFKLTASNGQAKEFSFYKVENKPYHILKVSDDNIFYEVNNGYLHDLDKLTGPVILQAEKIIKELRAKAGKHDYKDLP
jgi:hypothetical protein